MNKTIPVWEWTNEYDMTKGFVVYKNEVCEDVINALSMITSEIEPSNGEDDCVYNFEYHFHIDPKVAQHTLSILELIGEVVHGKWTKSKHNKVYAY